MIRYTQGNPLLAETEAIVNPVHANGVPTREGGREFKRAYPESLAQYEAAAAAKKIESGRVFVTQSGSLFGPRWLIHFPISEGPRQASRLEWITRGLVDLRRVIREQGIESIAVPPLGCGSGGLDWAEVRPVITEGLGDLPDVRVVIYEYEEAAAAGSA